MRSTPLLFRLIGIGIVSCSLSAALPPPELLTRKPQPGVTAAGDSTAPMLSANGQHVVFLSTARNLVPHGANDLAQVFITDLRSNVTQLVSVTPERLGGNGPSLQASVSANGQTVVFVSRADDLVPGDTNGLPDVFIRDLATGETRRVSVATNGLAGNRESGAPHVSSGGRYVVFESRATDLVAGDTNRVPDVFLYDAQTRLVSLLSSVSTDPAVASRPAGTADQPAISGDGDTALFFSSALNAAPGITSGGYTHTNKLYVRRPLDQPPRMVDVFTSGTGFTRSGLVEPLGWSLTPDGRFVALQAMPKTDNTTNALPKGLYWVDLDTGEVNRLPANLATSPLFARPVFSGPLISADGQTVLFEARETFGTGGTTRPVIYAWTVPDGMLTRVSCGGLWDDPNVDPPGPTEAPYGELIAMNADADFVAFLGGTLTDPAGAMPAQQLIVRRRSTGELRRISRTPDGNPLPDVGFPAVSFSDDGLRLVFQSESDQYVTDDRNRAHDVFLYDWSTDKVQLISRALPGASSQTAPGLAAVRPGAWSADARYLVFTSQENHLASGDTNGAPDVFRLDLLTGTSALVSVNLSGTGPANGASRLPSISGDGRFVVFTSVASDLVPGMTNGIENVFLRDMDSGTTTLVSQRDAPDTTPGRDSTRPVISADGRWVAFESTSPQLASPDSDSLADVFLFERATSAVSLVSSNHHGSSSAVGLSTMPLFSPDGRWLLFATSASDLVSQTVTPGWRVAAHDLLTGTNRVLSIQNPVASYTTAIPPRWAAGPVATFSGDSRWVLFSRDTAGPQPSEELAIHNLPNSTSMGLVAGTTSGSLSLEGRWLAYDKRTNQTSARQLHFLDRQSGKTTIVQSAHSLGLHTLSPIITPDGRFAVFTSRAGDLTDIPDDLSSTDVFLHDRVTDRTTLVSLDLNGNAGGRVSTCPILAADGRTLVFSSFATHLAEADLNRDQDLFLVRLPGPESEFRVTSIYGPGQSGTALVWAARAGHTYQLEWSADLESPSWIPLPNSIQIIGNQATATDTTAPANGNRFYRVIEDP